jgi:hypothetical protein
MSKRDAHSPVDVLPGTNVPALPTLGDRAEAVAAVRKLLPRIRARARQVDADRQVPAESSPRSHWAVRSWDLPLSLI